MAYIEIGVKTALSFQKYQTDELGKEIRPCRLKKTPTCPLN